MFYVSSFLENTQISIVRWNENLKIWMIFSKVPWKYAITYTILKSMQLAIHKCNTHIIIFRNSNIFQISTLTFPSYLPNYNLPFTERAEARTINHVKISHIYSNRKSEKLVFLTKYRYKYQSLIKVHSFVGWSVDIICQKIVRHKGKNGERIEQKI